MFRAHVVYFFLFLGHQYSISLYFVLTCMKRKFHDFLFSGKSWNVPASCFSEDDSEIVLQKSRESCGQEMEWINWFSHEWLIKVYRYSTVEILSRCQHAPLRTILGALRQARKATVGNKRLNFSVIKKPHTTDYVYCKFEAYFMIKSLWKNCIDCFEVNLE